MSSRQAFDTHNRWDTNDRPIGGDDLLPLYLAACHSSATKVAIDTNRLRSLFIDPTYDDSRMLADAIPR
jgi:hypothetical protein